MADNQRPEIDRKWRTWNLTTFHGGLNNKDSNTFLQDFELIKAEGIQVDSFGRVLLNGGWVTIEEDIIPENQNLDLGLVHPGRGLFHFKTDYLVVDSSGVLVKDAVFIDEGVDILIFQNGDFFHIRQQIFDEVRWAYNIVNIQLPGQFDDLEGSPSEANLEVMPSITSPVGFYADKSFVVCDGNFVNEAEINPRPLLKTLKFYNVTYFDNLDIEEVSTFSGSPMITLGRGNQVAVGGGYTNVNTYGFRGDNKYATHIPQGTGGIFLDSLFSVLDSPTDNKPGVSGNVQSELNITGGGDMQSSGFKLPWFSHSFPMGGIKRISDPSYTLWPSQHYESDHDNPSDVVHYIYGGCFDSTKNDYHFGTTKAGYGLGTFDTTWITGDYPCWSYWHLSDCLNNQNNFIYPGDPGNNGAYSFYELLSHHQGWNTGQDWDSITNFSAYHEAATKAASGDLLYSVPLRLTIRDREGNGSFQRNQPGKSQFNPSFIAAPFKPSDTPSFGRIYIYCDILAIRDAHGPWWNAQDRTHTPSYPNEVAAGSPIRGSLIKDSISLGAGNTFSGTGGGLSFVCAKIRIPKAGPEGVRWETGGWGVISGGNGIFRRSDGLNAPPTYESKRTLADIYRDQHPNHEYNPNTDGSGYTSYGPFPWKDCYIGYVDIDDFGITGFNNWPVENGPYWDAIVIGAFTGKLNDRMDGSGPEGAIDFANFRFSYKPLNQNQAYFPINLHLDINRTFSFQNDADSANLGHIWDEMNTGVANDSSEDEVMYPIKTSRWFPTILKIDHGSMDTFRSLALEVDDITGFTLDHRNELNVNQWNRTMNTETGEGNSYRSFLSNFSGWDIPDVSYNQDTGFIEGSNEPLRVRINGKMNAGQNIQPEHNQADIMGESSLTYISNLVYEESYHDRIEDLNYTFSQTSDSMVSDAGNITIEAGRGLDLTQINQSANEYMQFEETDFSVVQSLTNYESTFYFPSASRSDTLDQGFEWDFYNTISIDSTEDLVIGSSYAIFKENSGRYNPDNSSGDDCEIIKIVSEVTSSGPATFNLISTDYQVFDTDGIEYTDVDGNPQLFGWNNEFSNSNGNLVSFELESMNLGGNLVPGLVQTIYNEDTGEEEYVGGTGSANFTSDFTAKVYLIERMRPGSYVNDGSGETEAGMLTKTVNVGANDLTSFKLFHVGTSSLDSPILNYRVNIENSNKYVLHGLNTMTAQMGIYHSEGPFLWATLIWSLSSIEWEGESLPSSFEEDWKVIKKLLSEESYVRLKKAFGSEINYIHESYTLQDVPNQPGYFDKWCTASVPGKNGHRMYDGETLASLELNTNFSIANFESNNTWWSDSTEWGSTQFSYLGTDLNSIYNEEHVMSDAWARPLMQPILRSQPYSVSSTLNEDLNTSETTITVTDGSVFNPEEIIGIDNEFLYILNISGNDLECVRGVYDPYTGVSNNTETHTSGAAITIRVAPRLFTAGWVPVQYNPDRLNDQWNTIINSIFGSEILLETWTDSQGQEHETPSGSLIEDDNLAIEYYRSLLNQLDDEAGTLLYYFGGAGTQSFIRQLISDYWGIDL